MGFTTFNFTGGGDFGVSVSPDGGTCSGVTVTGFDHHGTNFRMLNCSCERHYLYSYSAVALDGDAGYDINTPLGSWTATNQCHTEEGGALSFYAAMRERSTPARATARDLGGFPRRPRGGTIAAPRGPPMLARLSVALTLSLAACAAHEGPNPTPTPTPEPRAEVQVAIASVQLAQDCPDPATDAAATPAKVGQAYAPPPPAAAAYELAPAQMQPAATAVDVAPGASMSAGAYARGGGWSPPCVQSTMQLSLANTGDRSGKLEIKAVRLLDAQSKRALGPMTSRKPSEWNPEGTYRPWNEEVAPRSTIKAAYRLAEPDWGRVQSDLGATVDLYSRPFVIEVEVAVDGRMQTIRSPEVLREQIHMIAT